MKKIFIVVAILLVILVPTYVGALGKEKDSNMEKPQSVELKNGDIKNNGQNKGITVNKLDIVYVEQNKAEEIIGTKYTSIKKLKGYKLMTVGNETYLYIGLGQKPTGGYAVEVVSLEDNEGRLNVQVSVKQPKPDDIVTQAITYPHKVLKLNFMPREVNIKAINTGEVFQEVKPEGISEY